MKLKGESKAALARVVATGLILICCTGLFYSYSLGRAGIVYSYLYYIAIVVGAFFYGISGGFIVSSLAGLAYAVLVLGSGIPYDGKELFPRIASFLLIGLITGLLSSRRKRAEDELRKSRGELEERVEVRTADLTAINERLQREITERKQAEKELKKTNVELKETQDQLVQAEKLQAVGMLATGVAHEVKNPLAIIMQAANYLEKELSPKGENTSEVLGMIEDSVRRADDIIRSLLDFSRATALTLQPEDINSVLEGSLTLMQQRLKFEQHIEIVKETQQDIPKVLVDKNRMEQVFINILLNAVQAMRGGGKIITRSYAKRLEETKNGVGRRDEDYFRVGEKVVIAEIEDTGIGISEKNLKRIFDPFFTTRGRRGGAGLGLSVTRNIVNMHKGLIDIESQRGKGTKVIITLKIAGAIE